MLIYASKRLAANVAATLTALVLAAGPALAAPMVWDGSCGDPFWFTCCEAGPNIFTNNWSTGTAVNCSSVVFPGPLDDVDIAANPVILNGNTTVLSFTSSGPFTIQSGALTAGLGATYATPVSWTGGGFGDGNHSLNAGANLSGPDLKFLTAGEVFNASTLTMTGTGSVQFNSGAVLHNLPGATLNLNSDIFFDWTGGAAGLVENLGVLNRLVSTGTTVFDASGGVVFDNAGQVNLGTGTMSLGGGGVNSGTIDIAAPATLEISGSTYFFNPGTSLTGDGLLRIVNGVLHVEDKIAVSVEKLTVAGGTRGGPGKLEVDGVMNWTGGTLDGGVTEIKPGATFHISNTAGVAMVNAHSLDIAGLAEWTGVGNITIVSGPAINILEGASFDAQNDRTLDWQGGAVGQVNIAGTFTKSAGNGTTYADGGVYFSNDGLIAVESGILRLDGGGVSTGMIDIASGSVFEIGNSTFVLSPGSSLAGDGTLKISGGSLSIDVDTDVSINNFEVSGGSRSGSGVLNVASTFNWTGGALTGDGITNIAPAVDWEISGTSTRSMTVDHVLNHAGTATWSGENNVELFGGAIFNNLAGATFDVQNNRVLDYTGGATCEFNNSGTFRKSAGVDTTTVDNGVYFTNSGLTDVLTGTLSLAGGGLYTGAINIAPSATVALDFGPHTFEGGTINGSGLLRLSNGSLTISADTALSVQNMTINGGTRNGGGTLVVTANLEWSGGALNSDGITSVGPQATLAINGNSTKFLQNDHLLSLAGNTTWSGTGNIEVSSGPVVEILGGAMFDVQNDRAFDWTGGVGMEFNNIGTLKKSAGPGTTLFDTNVLFSNSGAVQALSGTLQFNGGFVQSAGQTVLSGGNIGANSTMSIAGGELTGPGVVAAAVNNSGGALAPGAGVGQMSLSGAYTQGAAGTLEIQLGGSAGGTFDTVTVGGAATLNGTLFVELVDGYVPANGNTYQILTAASITGTFANIVTEPPCFEVAVSYVGASVILTVTSVTPGACSAEVVIVSANPPIDNPFVGGVQPFRDVLQTGNTPAVTQGIGATGTPAQDAVSYAPISVTFSDVPSPAPAVGNVNIACTGGACPMVASVAGSGAGPYTIGLSGPIPPGHCTTLTFAGTSGGSKLQYQYLPGDLNYNGSTSATDVSALVAAIANGNAALPANLPRYNVNRSGSANASDVLRLIGLLNGVNTSQPWTGASVTACPN